MAHLPQFAMIVSAEGEAPCHAVAAAGTLNFAAVAVQDGSLQVRCGLYLAVRHGCGEQRLLCSER